ncbi:type VI secretion system protein VasG [Rhodospira trueperi]|uniref:Type VI secretion system protein VasG n=2 Tax=Rhodospira trueperi TaxID=69960 RepID=A0A1G7G666_9PROT|nr:type VI secretion system ATPase TssH [Rhodospira trueperi]SDE83519.1 type VI secretion system protein VasG [Rhodospira trueperi]
MSGVDIGSLLARLSPMARRTLEGGVATAVSRTHFNAELEHWLLRMVEEDATDVALILKSEGIDAGQLAGSLTRALDSLKTGNARTPGLSPQILEAARDAWNLASLKYGADRVRTSHVLLAILSRDTLSATVLQSAPALRQISVEALTNTLPELTADSPEGQGAGAGPGAVAGPEGGAGGPAKKGGALDQFTIDLTQRARDGAIDPVLGRDQEIRQIIDILTRRRQNNPIMTGEAGVGKTAVVEGFALRVAAGDVPPSIKPCVIRTLDLGLLQAGAGMRGEFENRLKSVIEEVKASTQPIILFIDEAHTLIGAGGQAGQGDAANLLKPALARGELRTIAATTWAEYKKYFERDAALARRFQVVKVEEPSEHGAVLMMRGLVSTLEQHHGVRILDEAVVESVRLSHRYISGRQLPDKSVSLLDTACARVALSQHATPSQVEDLRRAVEHLDTAIGIAEREAQVDAARAADVTEMREDREAKASELEALEARWKEELALVKEIRDLRGKLETAAATDRATAGAGAAPDTEAGPLDAAAPPPEPLSDAEMAALRVELDAKVKALRTLQGEDPLMQAVVDGQAVAAVVGNWTGIPVGRMVSNEINTILSLQEKMAERILGQDAALEVISETVMSGRARLSDPRKPLAVFMLVGTSGVGKTESALALADLLYGGEQNMTVINMSEFKEEHKVSLLMGSPPGYVGYGEGGVLTEAVRRKPYSVVLLDEMEKAHPGVQDIFYQVFDKGMLKDGEGRDIDFKNTVIIMTSNAGTDTIHALCADPDTMPDTAGLYDALRPELLKVFKPAFLGRVAVVPFFPLPPEIIKGIARLQLSRVQARVADAYKANLDIDDAVIDLIAERATEVESGARVIDRIITRTILPDLSARILSCMAAGQVVRRATLTVGADASIECEVEGVDAHTGPGAPTADNGAAEADGDAADVQAG